MKVTLHKLKLMTTVSRMALDVGLFVGGFRMGLVKTVGSR